MELLEEQNLDIKYKLGRLNQAADALRWGPHGHALGAILTISRDEDMLDKLQDHWAHNGHPGGVLIEWHLV